MTTSHADCDHPATKAARNACRKERFLTNSTAQAVALQITHYQVTDFASICDTLDREGTTIESRVTCPKCLDRLAANAAMMGD